MASSSSSCYFLSNKELEKELKEAGNALFIPNSSNEELFDLLDKLESLLSKVAQEPSSPMRDALIPSIKALIADELLRHSNKEVKVSVVACISEIMRITAPDEPYNQKQMKEIFRLTVMSFEKLAYVSDRCHTKALQILETLAITRSCLRMLDLEFDDDALIIEMFTQFINIIRSNDSDALFTNMETIMTLVIEESEQVSLDILHLLLDSLKKEKENVSPMAWKLAAKVLENCAAKLKPYLPKAVESLSLAVDDYAEIVASMCQDAPGRDPAVGTEIPPNDDAMLTRVETKAFGDAVPRKRITRPNSLIKPEEGYDLSWISADKRYLQVSCRRKCHKKKNGGSAKTLVSKEAILPSEPEKKRKPGAMSPNADHLSNAGESVDGLSNSAMDNSPPQRVRKPNSLSEPDAEAVPQKRVRKPNSLIKPEEGYDHSWISGGKASKTKYKRKQTPQKEGGSKNPHIVKDYGEELIGCRIKVWWPRDQMFYKGVITSFDPLKTKHKVLYDDGDEEILNLILERWELFGDASEDQACDLPDSEHETDLPRPAALNVVPQKKKEKAMSDS